MSSNLESSNLSLQALPEICNAQQIAEVLGLNIKTIYGMAKRGEIPSFRAGRKVLFYRETVLDWLRGGQGRVSK